MTTQDVQYGSVPVRAKKRTLAVEFQWSFAPPGALLKRIWRIRWSFRRWLRRRICEAIKTCPNSRV